MAAWAVAIPGVLLFSRRKAYRAGLRVESKRAAAIALKQQDPEMYAAILAHAEGSDVEEAANRDPDAYVALFLSYADEIGEES